MLRNAFFETLSHLGQTTTLADGLANYHSRDHHLDLVMLRHDIDHDLDIALEMAHHEHRSGHRATYFLLHSAHYWDDDPDFDAKVEQLVAYGHEVGLHVNYLAQWLGGDIEDPEAQLIRHLHRLRNVLGDRPIATAAHGDQRCYRLGCINNWLWSELRSADPARNHSGLNAEGIIETDPERTIGYPTDHQLHRGDGAIWPLWNLSMEHHGIAYEAITVPHEHYWSDSGGSWKRSPDPLDHDLSSGRHQVLIHPIHWAAPPRSIFVLSSARSGSTWLANFVDKATPARGVHEWSLNHQLDPDTKDFVEHKRTNTDYAKLTAEPAAAVELLKHTVSFHDTCRRDTLEANVYLAPFVTELQNLFADPILVHLVRDGREVVRSILERGWFEAPLDPRHISGTDDEGFNQFERACLYWATTQRDLLAHCPTRIHFHRMTDDLDYLIHVLGELGLVVHPLLARREFVKQINPSRSKSIPPHHKWPEKLQRRYAELCLPLHSELELPTDAAMTAGGSITSQSDASTTVSHRRTRTIFRRDFRSINWLKRKRVCHAKHVEWSLDDNGLRFRVTPEQTSGQLRFQKSTWHHLHGRPAFVVNPAEYYRIDIRGYAPIAIRARLFALFFDREGVAIAHEHLCTLHPELESSTGCVVPSSTCASMGLSLHVTTKSQHAEGFIESLMVKSYRMPDHYQAMNWFTS